MPISAFDPDSCLCQLKSLWNELVPFGAIALAFPLFTVIAVSLVNTLNTSVPMLCVLAGVSFYVLLVWRFSSHLSTTTYVVAIGAIGLAMVIALPLRGILVSGDFGAEFGPSSRSPGAGSGHSASAVLITLL